MRLGWKNELVTNREEGTETKCDYRDLKINAVVAAMVMACPAPA